MYAEALQIVSETSGYQVEKSPEVTLKNVWVHQYYLFTTPLSTLKSLKRSEEASTKYSITGINFR